MSEKDHQALHLRYLDQHEAHPDRAEIGHGRRQRRHWYPPRKTEEGQHDVISASAERYADEQARDADRDIVAHDVPTLRAHEIAEARRIEEERIVVRRSSDVFRQRIEESLVRL